MDGVLLDSNVLLDILTEDPVWFDWSRQTLEALSDSSRLIINPVIFAEVSTRFSTLAELDQVLPPGFVDREPIPYEAAFIAGKAFREYRQRGGTRLSLLPDFLIGAHAACGGYRLVTRDVGRYRTYFPGVPLVTPA